MDKGWKVYIAESLKTGRYYTGISVDPRNRILVHNKGDGSRFARDQGPLMLVYESDYFVNKSMARKRELQIKGWRAEKKNLLIEGTIT